MISAAIILAAGRGSRMGGPKALLMMGDELLLVTHLRSLRAALRESRKRDYGTLLRKP